MLQIATDINFAKSDKMWYSERATGVKKGDRIMLVETRYEHVVLDERGIPIIAGTTMKVKELIAEIPNHCRWLSG